MKTILKGNLTKSIELKKTTTGISYAILNIAENHYQRDEKGEVLKDENGKWLKGETKFQFCAVYGELAEQMAQELVKGQLVTVIGRMRTLPERTLNNIVYKKCEQLIIESFEASLKPGERTKAETVPAEDEAVKAVQDVENAKPRKRRTKKIA